MRKNPISSTKNKCPGRMLLALSALLSVLPAHARPLRIAAEMYPPFEYQKAGKPVGRMQWWFSGIILNPIWLL